MLILEREAEESVEITTPSGDVIRIVHCGQAQNKKRIRLGIDAPRGYEILRDDARVRIPQGVAR